MNTISRNINPYIVQRNLLLGQNKMSLNKMSNMSAVIDKSFMIDTSFIDTSYIKDKVSFSRKPI